LNERRWGLPAGWVDDTPTPLANRESQFCNGFHTIVAKQG
jgi:hypothetical protein